MKTGGLRFLFSIFMLAILVLPKFVFAVPQVGIFGGPDHTGSSITATEQKVGVKFDNILWYKSDGEDPAEYWQSMPLAYAKSNGKGIQLAFEIGDNLVNIADGKHDAGIIRWANYIKNLDYPVMIRPLGEMNSNWTYWGGFYGTNTPQQYVPAYKHVVDVFRQNAGPKVTFIWAPNNVGVDRAGYHDTAANDLSIYYPGDDYVDYLGVDGYDFGGTDKTSFSQTFDKTIKRFETDPLFTKGNKPIMIAETASIEPSKPEYIRDMFYYIEKHPRIKQVYWFNLLKERDWRLETSQAAMDSFKNYYKTPPVDMCGDPTATNYTANFPYYDNSTCKFPPKPGCMDNKAYNYNPEADVNDASCKYERKHNRWY